MIAAFIIIALFGGSGMYIEGGSHQQLNPAPCHGKFPSKCVEEVIIEYEPDCRYIREFKGQKHWIGEDCGR